MSGCNPLMTLIPLLLGFFGGLIMGSMMEA